MTFTVVPLDCLDKLGIGYERDDADAYMHTWSVIAALMGIEEKFLPMSLDDARSLTEHIRRRQQRPSQDAVDLGGALIGAMQNSIGFRPARGLPGALLRFYCGDRVATIVGQGSALPVGLFFEPLQRLLRFVGLAQRVDVVGDVSRHVTAAVLRQFLDANRPGRDPFTLPLSLQARLMHTESRWHL
jgi:hypothetical protein